MKSDVDAVLLYHTHLTPRGPYNRYNKKKKKNVLSVSEETHLATLRTSMAFRSFNMVPLSLSHMESSTTFSLESPILKSQMLGGFDN